LPCSAVALWGGAGRVLRQAFQSQRSLHASTLVWEYFAHRSSFTLRNFTSSPSSFWGDCVCCGSDSWGCTLVIRSTQTILLRKLRLSSSLYSADGLRIYYKRYRLLGLTRCHG